MATEMTDMERPPSRTALARANVALIPNLIDRLRADGLPSFVPMQTLEMYFDCAKVTPDLGVQLYTPNGQLDDFGSFMIFVPEHRGNMYLHSTSTDETYLHSVFGSIGALQDICWEEDVWLGPIHARLYPYLAAMISSRGLKYKDPETHAVHNLYNFAISIEKALAIDVQVPEGFELRAVTEEDAEYVNEHWAYKDVKSPKYIRDNIRTRSGIALWRKEDNLMVSWALYCLIGGPGMVVTLPDHRGRGYGRIVSAVISRMVAADGKLPQVQIQTHIAASMRLFEGIGYEKTHDVNWYRLGL